MLSGNRVWQVFMLLEIVQQGKHSPTLQLKRALMQQNTLLAIILTLLITTMYRAVLIAHQKLLPLAIPKKRQRMQATKLK